MTPRKRRHTLPGLFSLLFLCGCVSTSMIPAFAEPKNDAEILKMIQDISLGSEYKSTAPVVSRWTRWSASLSVHQGTPEEQAITAEVVEELNQILKGILFSIKLKAPKSKEPGIKVIYAPKRDFKRIAKEHGFEYVSGNVGFFRFWSNEYFEIYRAVVMIDSGLSKRMKTHVTHEEITQALGLANDSKRSSSSIFFERYGDGGKVTQFSPLDKKIIRFFYKHLKPGYGKERVAEAFQKNWHKM